MMDEASQRNRTHDLLEFLLPEKQKPLTDDEKRQFADGVRMMINGPSRLDISLYILKAIVYVMVAAAAIKCILS